MIKILLQGNAGMMNMFRCFDYALDLSQKFTDLNIENKIFYDWIGWRCIHEIFQINYKNFCFDKFNNSENKQIILADTIDWLNIQDIIDNQQIIKVGNQHAKRLEFNSFIETFKVKTDVIEKIRTEYFNLNNGNYIGVHFRGSDILTVKNIDYKDFINNCITKLEGILSKEQDIILLASDNQEILKKYVDNKRIFTSSIAFDMLSQNICLSEQQRLHCTDLSFTKNKISEYDVCLSSVLDLQLLAHSKILYADTISGYGQGAKWLWNNYSKYPHSKLISRTLT